MTRLIATLVLFLLPMPTQSAAQELTIDQLVGLALNTSPELQAARTGADAARGLLVQAGLRPNPTVSSRRQEQVHGGDNQTMVEAEWPLDLFRRGARVAAARETMTVVSLSVRDRERLLAAAVREQAGRLLAAARTLAVTDDLLAINRRTRELLQARVTEGASPPLEVNLAVVEVGRLEAGRAIQSGRVEGALTELKALVGLTPDAPLVLKDSLEAVVVGQPPPPISDGASAPLPAERPDLREAAARIKLAEARIEQLRREGRVDASVYGNYMRMDFSFPERAFDAAGMLVPIQSRFHSVTVGLMATLPLRNRNQGAVAAAQAERTGAEHAAAARELMARAEISAALTRDREARRAVQIYASGTRDLARRNLDVIRQAYQLGRNSLLEVFTEQRRYLDLENAYIEALSEAYQARVVLRRAVGDVQ